MFTNFPKKIYFLSHNQIKILVQNFQRMHLIKLNVHFSVSNTLSNFHESIRTPTICYVNKLENAIKKSIQQHWKLLNHPQNKIDQEENLKVHSTAAQVSSRTEKEKRRDEKFPIIFFFFSLDCRMKNVLLTSTTQIFLSHLVQKMKRKNWVKKIYNRRNFQEEWK